MPGEAQPNSVTENTASPLDLSRRDFVATASAAAGGFALAPGSARAATVGTDIANLPPYGNGTLPPGIRSRPIANVNGLTVHILEAGYEVPGRPAVPSLPFNTANGAPLPRPAQTDDELDAELAKLSPPRKYYQNYQRTRGANDDMLHAPQGLHAFFRAYYHYKS